MKVFVHSSFFIAEFEREQIGEETLEYSVTRRGKIEGVVGRIL
ncbi:hypothetical protein V6Z11_A08G202000 [Gossypium hirsutum]